MAVQNLTNPTNAEVAEYWRTYRAVLDAHRDGYHLPYSNLHDDAGLWTAYSTGFGDACNRVAKSAAA